MPRLEFQFRKLEQWPREQTQAIYRRTNPYKSKLPATLRLLAHELHTIGAINPLFISTDHDEKQIRIDGLPRDDVKPPKFPGVIVEFMARNGRLIFACDSCTRWYDNLRSIALTLESLRAVDRYGATGSDEQYAGFKALPPPGQSGITVEDAAVYVANEGGAVPFRDLIGRETIYRAAYRKAAAKLHPDNKVTGNEAGWDRLQQCAVVLDNHFKKPS